MPAAATFRCSEALLRLWRLPLLFEDSGYSPTSHDHNERKADCLARCWAKDDSQAARCINAKAETVDVRPAFREAFRRALLTGYP